MSREHPKRRTKCPPFVRLERTLIDSLAFSALRPASVVVLISILRRFNGMNGIKSDPIICPYRAMKGSMAPATISKAIKDLVAHGFIGMVQHGGLYKQPNSYALLLDWRNWQPEKKKSTSENEADRFIN